MTRLLILRMILGAVFLTFVGTLVVTQGISGARWRELSVRNHLRWERVPAPRGLIVDRNGKVLAANRQALALWLVSGEVPRKAWDGLVQRLVDLGTYPDLTTAQSSLADVRRAPGYVPIRLKDRLTIEEVSRLEEELAFLPGLYLKEEKVRLYPEGTAAAHALGYVREISGDELTAHADDNYLVGDRIGKTGVERLFEAELRGADGGDQVQVDANGRVLRDYPQEHREPQQGQTLTLTLDLDLQRAAEAAMQAHRGAAVALDPNTGEILALVSAPTYDLNLMADRRSPEFQQWLTDTEAETNRATVGAYPPGSVFKIVTGAAACEDGAATPDAYWYCEGLYHGIHCWKRSGHGAVDLTNALAQSCNVAFMKMAETLGIESLAAMGRRFGLGDKVNAFGIDREIAGTMPDLEWAKQNNHAWQLGETLQVGIGQANLIITPLQGARLVSVIANGGKLVSPRLVQKIGDSPAPMTPPAPTGLSEATIRRLATGLRAVVGEGTARKLDPQLQIAGKTGTAQNPGEDHAWFVGYAPAEAPRIAVAVLVEHGGHGGEVAAPIAEAIIRTALQGPQPSPVSQ